MPVYRNVNRSWVETGIPQSYCYKSSCKGPDWYDTDGKVCNVVGTEIWSDVWRSKKLSDVVSFGGSTSGRHNYVSLADCPVLVYHGETTGTDSSTSISQLTEKKVSVPGDNKITQATVRGGIGSAEFKVVFPFTWEDLYNLNSSYLLSVRPSYSVNVIKDNIKGWQFSDSIGSLNGGSLHMTKNISDRIKIISDYCDVYGVAYTGFQGVNFNAETKIGYANVPDGYKTKPVAFRMEFSCQKYYSNILSATFNLEIT